MARKVIAILVLFLTATVIQVLLPILPGGLSFANPFLALLVVLALRQGTLAGVLWGASLGAVSDTFAMPYLGFHGLAFSIAGYLLGWAGSRFLLEGFLPPLIFSCAAFFLDTLVVGVLYAMLKLELPSPFLYPLLAGGVLTVVTALGLEALYQRIYPKDLR